MEVFRLSRIWSKRYSSIRSQKVSENSCQIRVFSASLLPTHFGPNTEKHRPEKTPYLSNFHFVQSNQVSKILLLFESKNIFIGNKFQKMCVILLWEVSCFLFCRETSSAFTLLPLPQDLHLYFHMLLLEEGHCYVLLSCFV